MCLFHSEFIITFQPLSTGPAQSHHSDLMCCWWKRACLRVDRRTHPPFWCSRFAAAETWTESVKKKPDEKRCYGSLEEWGIRPFFTADVLNSHWRGKQRWINNGCVSFREVSVSFLGTYWNHSFINFTCASQNAISENVFCGNDVLIAPPVQCD